MKIIFLLTFFLFDLFAVCSNTPTTWGTGSYLGNYTSKVSGTLVNNYDYPAMTAQCSQRFSGIILEIACPTCTATNISVTTNGNTAYCTGNIVYTPNPCPNCPTGTYLDPDGTCHPNPIVKCSWATNPPYHSTTLAQSECNNAQKIGSTLEPYYLWNFSWCPADSTCYGRYMYCPAGQYYDSSLKTCKTPSPKTNSCPSGYYKICKGVTSAGGTSCSCDFICKDDPTKKLTYEVSCEAKPVDNTPLTNPDAPNEAPEDNPSQPVKDWDTAGQCFQKQTDARWACNSPKVLSFYCDPKTGKVIRNECKDPTLPTQTPIAPGDSTKNSTSEDIKNLANSLPTGIRDALKDWFTDGSMPHLEAIRGTLQASTILQADANDKLISISASADASLGKLDGIKTSTDGVKTAVDGVTTALNQGGTYSGATMPTENDLKPTDPTSDFDTFTNSITQTKDSFYQAYNLFSRGVPSVTIGSGSCPTFSFYGKSYSLGSIGQSIAPYSSVFSILIYISLMFRAFRIVFSFFSKGI